MAHYTASQERSRRRAKHYVEYGLLRGFLFFLSLLPLGGALWVARRLGDFAFDVLRMRRDVALTNLRRAFGERYSPREYERIARSCYRNFAMTFVEFGLFGKHSVAQLGERMHIAHREAVAEAGAARKGILFLTAHVGNWELMGACMALIDRPLTVVSGDQKNLLVDGLVKRLRKAGGMQIIPIGSSLRGVMKALRQDGRVALVADQDGGRDGIFLEFFGRTASTYAGPARFAYRTGAPIVIGLDRHTGGGAHEARFYPPIFPDRSRPEAEEIRRILTEYTRILEDFVRENPDQWFWMHRRWKTRPEAEDDKPLAARGRSHPGG